MEVDGVLVVALPFLEVVRQGNADALGFQVVLRVDAASIVEHDETLPQRFLWVFVDGTLILHQFLPPLHVLVVDAEQGLCGRLPFVGLGDVALRPCHADVQWFTHCLIACAVSADVGHPMLAFIFAQFVTAAPCPVDEGRETTTLVGIPACCVGRITEQAPLCLPVQQVVRRCQPRLIAAPVQSVLAVIDNIGHQPLVAHTEHCWTVYLVVVVRGGYHHTIFIGRAHLVIDALHDVC